MEIVDVKKSNLVRSKSEPVLLIPLSKEVRKSLRNIEEQILIKWMYYLEEMMLENVDVFIGLKRASHEEVSFVKNIIEQCMENKFVSLCEYSCSVKQLYAKSIGDPFSQEMGKNSELMDIPKQHTELHEWIYKIHHGMKKLTNEFISVFLEQHSNDDDGFY